MDSRLVMETQKPNGHGLQNLIAVADFEIALLKEKLSGWHAVRTNLEALEKLQPGSASGAIVRKDAVSGRSRHGSTERAAQSFLEADRGKGFSLTEVAKGIDADAASTFRVLKNLCGKGLARKEDKLYLVP